MEKVCYNGDIDPAKGVFLRSQIQNKGEYFDVLDENGQKTGRTKLRQLVHRDGDWHHAVDIAIINDAGQMLLQRRADDKDSWPGYWDFSCGGHVVAGEEPIQAAVNELKEEVGLAVNPEDLKLLGVFKHSSRPAPDFINNGFSSLYVLRCDQPLEDYTIQPEEISELRFFSPAEIRAMAADSNSKLVPHHDWYERALAEVGQ